MSNGKGLWRINRPTNNQDAPEAAGIRPKCQTPIVWHEPGGGYQEGSSVRLSNILTDETKETIILLLAIAVIAGLGSLALSPYVDNILSWI